MKGEGDKRDVSVGPGFKYRAARHPRPQEMFQGVICPGFSGGPILTLPGMVTLLNGSAPQSPHGDEESTECTSAAQLSGANRGHNQHLIPLFYSRCASTASDVCSHETCRNYRTA